MNEKYLALVLEILRVHCRIEGPVEPTARLREDLGLDSVGILTLMVELENALQKTIQENPENPPETVETAGSFSRGTWLVS